ncbi:integumentary mucin A.1-like [Zerene cesonia]|uniref:integumentary mucin A.1-like n=1 Tax=Zerene cesonia TaxID=33412 RepID=UPI0018E4E4FF|nr:integumentary mucin A.1-like [Zerene cesonia]
MLPARSIVLLSLFSIAIAFPADKPVHGSITALVDQNVEKSSIYSSFPLFSIFKPIIEMFPNFSDIGPEIEAGKDYTNIIVKVKNYKLEDLSVKIKGKYIYLQGNRKTVDGDRDLASEFLYTATLPSNVNTNDVFAKLYSDGILVVTTPNEGKEGVYEDRAVPIVVLEEPFVKPVESVNVVPAAPEEKVPEVTTVPPTEADVPETTTQAETTAPPQEESSEQPTTSIVESTTNVPEVEEKETTKVEEVETTTPYIEVVTLNTTPYEPNEISDLEPINVTY